MTLPCSLPGLVILRRAIDGFYASRFLQVHCSRCHGEDTQEGQVALPTLLDFADDRVGLMDERL